MDWKQQSCDGMEDFHPHPSCQMSNCENRKANFRCDEGYQNLETVIFLDMVWAASKLMAIPSTEDTK